MIPATEQSFASTFALDWNTLRYCSQIIEMRSQPELPVYSISCQATSFHLSRFYQHPSPFVTPIDQGTPPWIHSAPRAYHQA